MSTTVGGAGRLGNQVFRNTAVSLIAEKHNLFVSYGWNDAMKRLGIVLFVGTTSHTNNVQLTDENYFSVLNSDIFANNVVSVHSYFQTKEISNYICKYFRNDLIKGKIESNNPFRSRYNTNNDVFIHVRLDDIVRDGNNWNVSVDYYLKALSCIPSYDNLYISSDSKDHAIIKRLLNGQPRAHLIEYDEIQTIQFASTCKHVILSHGSFSAIIGYLSFYSTVYYPAYELARKIWFGDMFSIDGWNKIHNIEYMYGGQAQQDKFVLNILKEKRAGYFLEIGSNDPIQINNTYILEKNYDWSGIMVEYDPTFLPLYNKHRPNSIHIINDATKIDYKNIFQINNVPSSIDYLQIDLEAYNGSTIQTLQKLDTDIFDNYTFATVTFEHDIYRTNNYNTRELSRTIFNKRGYVRVFNDVANGSNPFEDWYVHPTLVDMNYVNHLIQKNKIAYVTHPITGTMISWESIQY